MPIQKLPSGSRGSSSPSGVIVRSVMKVMTAFHRRSGDAFQGMDLTYLTTVGAKSGQERTTPVARIDDGQGGWLVCASAGGAKNHPSWYHNIVAHPDQVWAEVAKTRYPVTVDQLEGAEREAAWQRMATAVPRFEGYLKKTDRTMPVLRLTPAPTPGQP